MQNKLKVPIR